MPLPKISPRRWFWSLTTFALCWSFAGWHLDPQGSGPIHRTEEFIRFPAQIALTPPSWICTSCQIFLSTMLRPGSGDNTQTAEELQNENAALLRENTRLNSLLTDARLEIRELHQLAEEYHIPTENVLQASVTGYGAGTPTGIINLDKGSQNGVKEGSPVVTAADNVSLLGRVVSVTPWTSEARLISDPGGPKVRIQIVRPVARPLPDGTVRYEYFAVTAQPYLLVGRGGGQMEIDGINVSDAMPQKGDLVCLTDADWWANTQHMVLGQIEAVGKQANNPLRYSISVLPPVAIVTQRRVMVVLKE